MKKDSWVKYLAITGIFALGCALEYKIGTGVGWATLVILMLL